jgi:CBS-domain-containing membrane protein
MNCRACLMRHAACQACDDDGAAALAVGLAMLATYATDTLRLPADINPIIVVLNDQSWGFLLVPMALGGVLLALCGLLWQYGLRWT